MAMVEIVTSSTPDSAALLQLLAQRDAEIRAKDLLIEKLKLQLANLRRHRFGSKSEALDHVIEQLELMLEDIEASSAEAPEAANICSQTEFTKVQPKRRPLPDHLPREEVVLSPGDTCHQCGGRLRKIGEDVSETLEYVPARFKVIRTVRPKLACRHCDGVLQVSAPVLPIEHGRPGPGLLAHVLVSKYADHLPLYRQSQIYAREGVELERSTLADWVGKSTALLSPLVDAIGRHVMDGAAIHADDTPVNVLAPGTGRTRTGRLWVYLRDEHDWGNTAPPAAWYRFTEVARASGPESTSRTSRAGCMPMAMPGSRISTAAAGLRKSPAWRMSGASSSISTSLRALQSPRKHSSALPNSTGSRTPSEASLLKSDRGSAKNTRRRGLISWNNGS